MTESNSTNNFIIEHSFLGKVDYQKSEEIQKNLLSLAISKKQFSIIGLEHPAVITLGHRASLAGEVFESTSIPIVKSSRGGLATLHSEGQLVIYPVLNLKTMGLGVKDYVCLLLKATQDMLQQLDISSTLDESAIGLYTANGKIAFCGIKVEKGITQHGISLNVRNDLNLFDSMRSCGVQNQMMDQLHNYGIDLSLKELFSIWVSCFKNRLT